jgi:hypothetical protein
MHVEILVNQKNGKLRAEILPRMGLSRAARARAGENFVKKYTK